jgi:phosphoesterase RecJ-like protein
MTMTQNLNWTEAAAAVDAAAEILIVAHVSPDGDAIGSLVGLGNALSQRGKRPDLVVDGGVPDHLRFLPGTDAVIGTPPVKKWDVMISVDSSDEVRTGQAGAFGRANSRLVINIDHHATNIGFGQIHLVDPTAVSTTEVIARWLIAIGQTLTPEIAQPLLTGLVTDTNGFRTTGVRPETLDLARLLMASGASLQTIMARTLNSKPYKALALWRSAMQHVELEDGIIASQVSLAELNAAGYDEPTDADFVSLLIQIEEAVIAAVFKETPDGAVRLSLRSKPGYDVGAVALALGGGGHYQAAGATVIGTLEDARRRVMPMLREVVERVRAARS